MPFRTPMRLDEINQISHRRRDDVEITALVWEITRLQSIVAQAAQLLAQESTDTETQALRRELLQRLADEPVVNWKV